MTGTIVIRLELTGWTADYTRTSARRFVEAVYGSTRVALGWPVSADADAVANDVMDRAPDATVVVERS